MPPASKSKPTKVTIEFENGASFTSDLTRPEVHSAKVWTHHHEMNKEELLRGLKHYTAFELRWCEFDGDT